MAVAAPLRYKSVANCLYCCISLLVGEASQRRGRNRSPQDTVITSETHSKNCYCRRDAICPARQLVYDNECSEMNISVILPLTDKPWEGDQSPLYSYTKCFVASLVFRARAGTMLAGMKVCVGGCLLPEFEQMSQRLSLSPCKM